MRVIFRKGTNRRESEEPKEAFTARAGRVWVVSGCIPTPAQPRHCIFIARQLEGLSASGLWRVRVLLPRGWYPPWIWRLARGWRNARAETVPRCWTTANRVDVERLTYQNRVPARCCRPRDALGRIGVALLARLRLAGARPDRDVILTEFALPYGPAAIAVAQSLGLRHAVYLRGDDVLRDPYQNDTKRQRLIHVIRSSDLILSVSQALIDKALQLADHPAVHTAVIPNGINLNLFHPAHDLRQRALVREKLGVNPEDALILCVAPAFVTKGYEELFSALGRCVPASATGRIVLLAVTGNAPPQLDLSELRNSRAARITLIVKRDTPPDLLADWYRAADAFALLSHSEGMANSLLEALASGLPAVATDVGGHAEVITNGVNGFLTAPREHIRAARVIQELLDNPQQRRELGAAARQTALRIGTSAENGRRLAVALQDMQNAQRS